MSLAGEPAAALAERIAALADDQRTHPVPLPADLTATDIVELAAALAE